MFKEQWFNWSFRDIAVRVCACVRAEYRSVVLFLISGLFWSFKLLRFEIRQQLWRMQLSFETCRHVVWCRFTDVSEEGTAFCPKAGRTMFPRNTADFLPNYASYTCQRKTTFFSKLCCCLSDLEPDHHVFYRASSLRLVGASCIYLSCWDKWKVSEDYVQEI